MELNVIFSDDRGEFLEHYGVPGMKWGVRKARPTSGKRYNTGKTSKSSTKKNRGLSDRQKKAIKIGAAVAGTALVAYGGYKLGSSVLANKQLIKQGKELAQRRLSEDKAQLNDALKATNLHKNSTDRLPNVVVTKSGNSTSIASRAATAKNNRRINNLIKDMDRQRAIINAPRKVKVERLNPIERVAVKKRSPLFDEINASRKSVTTSKLSYAAKAKAKAKRIYGTV